MNHSTKNRRAIGFLLLLSFGAASLYAQEAQAWKGTCQIQFSGKSTLHPFTGNVAAEPFSISISNPDDLTKASARGKIIAKVSKLNTSNTKRDKKMRKVLNAASFSDVLVDIGTLTAAATKPKSGGTVPQPTIIPFELTIKGKKQKVTGQVSNWSYTDKNIGFHVTFPVSLTAFDIKPPSVIGVVKVDDTINVKAVISLNRK